MNLLNKRVMMSLLGLIKHVAHTVRLRLLCVMVSADSRMNEVDADTNLVHLHEWLLDQQTERSCIGQLYASEQGEAQSEQRSS
jgi:hypothetical protein